jgi:hypothetical protein
MSTRSFSGLAASCTDSQPDCASLAEGPQINIQSDRASRRQIPFQVSFASFQGFLLEKLLQMGPVRFHRIQRGWVDNPCEYKRFIAEVIGPRIVDTNCRRLGIFGTGEHTRIILNALPELLERVQCFADNNHNIQGQQLMNRPVCSPENAVKICDGFILSTAIFQHEMHKNLQKLGFKGPVIAMDDDVPPHWFLIQEDYDLR